MMFFRFSPSSSIPLLAFLASCISIAAQQTSQPDANTPVFRSSSRLVLVDVVVLDGSGRPVEGLTAKDFNLVENGRPQQLKVFEPHVAKKEEPAKPFDLPPHQYTNVPDTESKSPLTVVLFDTLNTPVNDQVAVRRHMLEFLKSLPPGQRVGLFALGSKLRLVQSFTGQSEVLIAAAKNLSSEASPLLSTEVDRQRSEDDLTYRERIGAPSIGSNTGGGAATAVAQSLGQTAAEESQRLRDAFAREDAVGPSHRAGMTLEALAELAVMLRGYPGRKNLLWLSGGFPFSIGPNALMRTEFRDDVRFDQALHGVATLLANSQVAVYPIDAAGVVTSGISIESNGEGAMGVDGITGISRTSQLYSRQLTERTDTRSTMDEIAEQTGGKAFYGSNDLKLAMQKSLEQGSSYYTLAYSPGDENWNGKFRRIQVRVLRGNYRLQYRRGYYALAEPEHSPDESTRKLAAALRPDMPNATSLYMKAEILPPVAGKIRVTYLIDPQQITFSDLPDGRKHVLVDLLAVTWDKKGHDVGHAAHTIEATLDRPAFLQVMHAGLQATQYIEAKPNAYRVRIGAVDRASQQVGTLDAIVAPDRAAASK